MKYSREDRVKILEYKFIFEEALQAQREFEEGAADLNYRLSFFREKLHKNSESKDQKKRYDQMFMGGVPKNNDLANVNQQPDKQEVTQIVSKSRNNVKPWVLIIKPGQNIKGKLWKTTENLRTTKEKTRRHRKHQEKP